ncbi:TonB-dependent receptor [Galbibacter mesophilus]|uniref:TonB-dependent receptor n=1 Tax=Galbibacter mesophilus TaxID=379069 RepID=UPI00191F7DD1|nr:TonB-dependent receptor [Galbibacter mesophilus]MCM5661416.1 TonB-dependent receptor [Galbibacter mesophilus]
MKKIVTLLFLATTLYGFSQGNIKGKVTTESGTPISMVNVMLKNTNKGTETNHNGNFNLQNVDAGNYTLVVTYMGFVPQELTVNVQDDETTQLNGIILKESTEFLDEVVLNGNGSNDYVVKTPSSSLRLKTEVLKLPQNIQIVSNELIKSQNIINMMESVTRNVSGAQMIEHWGTFARINMRGFKLPAFRNGMNVELPWGPLSEDMSMVNNIEFVKGPAGFMLSAGEPGGFYNVVTKKPVKENINEITLTAGSFNTYRATFDSGGALTKDGKLQYRFNGMYQENESFREFEEGSRFSIVPSLRYEISDKTQITTEFTYQEADQMIGSAYVFAPIDDGFGSLPQDFSGIDKDFPSSDIEELSLLTNLTHNFNDKWQVQGQYMYMDYSLEGSSTWPVTPNGEGVLPNGDMYRGVSIWDALSTNELAQIYVNGEFNTGGITHKILGGFDYRNLEYWADWGQGGNIDVNGPFNIYNPVYGNAVYPVFNRSQSVKERGAANYQGNNYRAFYLQDEAWMFNNRLRITLAARYNDATIFAYGQESNDEKVTPRIGVSFDILPGFTAYGLYDEAFTPQYGQSYNNQRFDPLESVDIEGGLKKEWFNGKLNTSITAYQITKNNYLVTDFEHPAEDGSFRFSTQTGEVQSKGIEFDMQGQITECLNVVFNYAHTDVRITEDTNPDNIGTRIAGHAKHITNGWVNYTFHEDNFLKGFGVSLGYQYQVDRSSWAWGAENNPLLPDYFRLDGGISWAKNNFRVNLNVNNILDEYLYSGSAYAKYLYWQSEPGINGRITLAYRF